MPCDIIINSQLNSRKLAIWKLTVLFPSPGERPSIPDLFFDINAFLTLIRAYILLTLTDFRFIHIHNTILRLSGL